MTFKKKQNIICYIAGAKCSEQVRSVTAGRELNKIKEARWAKALRNSRERLRILWVFFYTHSPVSRP
ncbi:hypothetical protein CLOSTASPAR_00469 [[Clostridium] asparagiforme DSM 15981]|uniref:Uncharacterized protein n=1 Tax=[Clostridium] asparagiforme DSM 15981 TaxID=518636 RepID=C0CU20_9FIRM|nr:hypothetical protein CLOSTASPAR_00469 [[Clostridium] asparagiforme DSM 15981]